MAVEEDATYGVQQAQEWQPRTELVDKVGIWAYRSKFGGEVYLQDEVELSKNGAEDAEAREYRRRNYAVASNADIESACGSLQESQYWN